MRILLPIVSHIICVSLYNLEKYLIEHGNLGDRTYITSKSNKEVLFSNFWPYLYGWYTQKAHRAELTISSFYISLFNIQRVGESKISNIIMRVVSFPHVQTIMKKAKRKQQRVYYILYNMQRIEHNFIYANHQDNFAKIFYHEVLHFD